MALGRKTTLNCPKMPHSIRSLLFPKKSHNHAHPGLSIIIYLYHVGGVTAAMVSFAAGQTQSLQYFEHIFNRMVLS